MQSNNVLSEIRSTKTEYLKSTNKVAMNMQAFNFIKEQDKEYNEIFTMIEAQNKDDKLQSQKQKPLGFLEKGAADARSARESVSKLDSDPKRGKKVNLSSDLYNLDSIKSEVFVCIPGAGVHPGVRDAQGAGEDRGHPDDRAVLRGAGGQAVLAAELHQLAERRGSPISAEGPAGEGEEADLQRDPDAAQDQRGQGQRQQEQQGQDAQGTASMKQAIEDQVKIQAKIEAKNRKLQAIINQLKIGIPIIFERIGCNFEEYQKEFLQTLVSKLYPEHEGLLRQQHALLSPVHRETDQRNHADVQRGLPK